MHEGIVILDTIEFLPNLQEDLQYLTLDMLQRMIYSTVFALNVPVILALYELCKEVFISTDTFSLKTTSKKVIESALQSFSGSLNPSKEDKSQCSDEIAEIFGWNVGSMDELFSLENHN